MLETIPFYSTSERHDPLSYNRVRTRDQRRSRKSLPRTSVISIAPQRLQTVLVIVMINIWYRSSGGVVVKLLACEERGPGFDSRSRNYDFRDLFSPAPRRDMPERSLKRRKSSNQPTNTRYVVFHILKLPTFNEGQTSYDRLALKFNAP